MKPRAIDLRALLGSWTAQDEQGRWTVYRWSADGEIEAIATGCEQCATSNPSFYFNHPPITSEPHPKVRE